jgi:hypothetical protein
MMGKHLHHFERDDRNVDESVFLLTIDERLLWVDGGSLELVGLEGREDLN